MLRSSTLSLCVLAACGRVGYDDQAGSLSMTTGGDGLGDLNAPAGDTDDAGSDSDDAGGDADDTAGTPEPNYVFVTSQTIVLGSLGSLSAADALCGTAATNAGLAGTYVAFLSTSTVAAQDRIAGARGWVRRDGKPVLDAVADLATGKLYHPILLDEFGAVVRARVGTATKYGGPAATCGDLNSTQGTTHGGYSDATATFFTSSVSNLACSASLPIYCFGVDRVAPLVPPAPVLGKRIFVGPTFSASGISGADALCTSAAASGGLVGTFKAVLPSAGSPAGARFTGTNGPVVRIDGVQVAATVAELFLGQLDSPPNQTIDGSYVDSRVLAGSPTSHCTNWTENSGALTSSGVASLAQAGFLGSAYGSFISQTCGAARPVYCLEE